MPRLRFFVLLVVVLPSTLHAQAGVPRRFPIKLDGKWGFIDDSGKLAIPNLNIHQTFAQLPDYDSETDQYNTDNRHDSPTGRWLSPDPGGLKVVHLDDPQTWNMYAYVRNNPTTLTDPTGLDPCSITVPVGPGHSSGSYCMAEAGTKELETMENAHVSAVADVTAKAHVAWSDLDVLNGADKRLCGDVIAHAGIESYNSAKPSVSVDLAHDTARGAFGFLPDSRGWQPNTTGPRVTAPSLLFRDTRARVDFNVTTKLRTPIPLATFDPGRTPGPRDVTDVRILPPEK
jgi:RHS repeat-associated protein